ncbi:MAG: adenylate/guanylate cyclase domain-containing protein [Halopseudomonas sp.]
MITAAPNKNSDSGNGATSFRVIMFTDLADSTALTEQLGDQESARLIVHHNHLVRSLIARFQGQEIKFTGDGFHISFDSVSDSIACAITLQQSFAEHNRQQPQRPLRLKVGLSAGCPVAVDNDLFGSVVNLAARLCQRAGCGRILASARLKELCSGWTGQFIEQPEIVLKGFAQPVTAYGVVW